MEKAAKARRALTDVQEALKAVDGVAEAVVEESDGSPVGVRVELEIGADERVVASSVQDILSSHGLRSRLAPPRSRLEPLGPPPPPTVLPIRPAADPHIREEATTATEPSGPPLDGIDQIVLRQHESTVSVVVSDAGGNSIELVSRGNDEAVTQTIVEAVARLVNPQGPSPGVVLAESRQAAGIEVVTLVLDLGGGISAAAAEIVSSGNELAVAKAAWKALTADS